MAQQNHNSTPPSQAGPSTSGANHTSSGVNNATVVVVVDVDPKSPKMERRFCAISEKSVELICESAGFPEVVPDVCKPLADTLNYNLRKIIHVSRGRAPDLF